MEWREEKIHWSDVLFNRQALQMNKRVSRVSPRRGKRQADRAIERVFGNPAPDMGELLDMFDAIEEHGE